MRQRKPAEVEKLSRKFGQKNATKHPKKLEDINWGKPVGITLIKDEKDSATLLVADSKHNLIYKIKGAANLWRLKQPQMNVTVVDTSGLTPFYPFGLKNTNLDDMILLITEPSLAQVSLVSLNESLTSMNRISIIKHPTIFHPVDALYMNNRCLLTDIGKLENDVVIQTGIKEINLQDNQVKCINSDCILPFALRLVRNDDCSGEDILVSDFEGHTVRRVNLTKLTDDGKCTSTIIKGIHNQEGHKDGKNGTLCQPTGICFRGRSIYIAEYGGTSGGLRISKNVNGLIAHSEICHNTNIAFGMPLKRFSNKFPDEAKACKGLT